VTDPNSRSSPAPTPGERRLPHPPSNRYREPVEEGPAPERGGSLGRAVVLAIAAALAGAAATTVLGGVLAVSAGLVVVAGAIGWAVAVALRVGGGSRLDVGRRLRLAIPLSTLAVALGQLGLWLYARSEGGVLGPVDYLAETFGLLVPLQFGIAWVVAWATAR
jgi:hypothetical protein